MQEFSQRRARDSRKPALSECPEVEFYRCGRCGSVYQRVGFDRKNGDLCCCGERIILLEKQNIKGLPAGYGLDYEIRGGHNDNTVVVKWKADKEENAPLFLGLKTFTGLYLKYARSGRTEMRFALADLDAFVYCDKDPCLECTFRCKRGFSIFLYNAGLGLFELPIDKFSSYWNQ